MPRTFLFHLSHFFPKFAQFSLKMETFFAILPFLCPVVSEFQKVKDRSKDRAILMLRSRSDRRSFFKWRLGSGSRSQFLIEIGIVIAISILGIRFMPCFVILKVNYVIIHQGSVAERSKALV